MKKLFLIFALVSLLAFSLIFMPKLVFQQIKTEDTPDFHFAPGKIVIRFSKEVSPVIPFKVGEMIQTGIGPIDELSLRFKVHTMRRLFSAPKYPTPDLTRYFVVKFDASIDLDQVVTAFSQIPFFVEKVEKVTVLKYFSDDNYFGVQWHLEQSNDCDIDAPGAWDIETGSDSVILAIADSGVQYTHPDLNNNIWINWYEYNGTPGQDDDPNGGNGKIDDIYGWDFDDDDNTPTDTYGHGTHVAGIAAAETNNGPGVAGIAGGWYPGQGGCRIMCLCIGHSGVDMSNAAEAFYYATDMGATAINCSWGSEYTEYFKDALDYALLHDVLIVAAAGNDNGIYCDDPNFHYLNMVPGVLVVAATDQNDQRAIFGGGQASNYGPCIDVSAPGKDIWSTYKDSSYTVLSGTSMAAPMAVGLAGLLKSERPDWGGGKIRDAIVESADYIDVEEDMGSGRINAHYALKQTLGPPTAPSNLDADAVASNQINLSWQDNSNNENGFEIQRKEAGGTFTKITTAGRDVTSYQDKNVSCGTTYYYRIRAYNVSGNSGFSNEASATTPSDLPEAPSNLAGYAECFDVLIMWEDNSNNEEGFKIERAMPTTFVEIDRVGPNSYSYGDNDLECQRIYIYRVRAYNACGNSPYSNIASTKTTRCRWCEFLSLEITPDKEIINSGEPVTYAYELKNKEKVDLTDVELIDDKLGKIAAKFTLKKGETKTFTKTATLTETTTNFAEATAIYYHEGEMVNIKIKANTTVKVKK